MAIYTPGPTVAAVSGSIGGTVYSRNRGGAYLRNRAIPTNPDTSFQQIQRSILATNSQDFADLTDVQREAWRQWAIQNPITNALGNSITMSGHQAFVKLNSRLDTIGETTIVAPPIVNAPPGLESMILSADIGTGTFDLTFTASPLGAGQELFIFAAVTNSAAIRYVRNLLKFVGVSAAAQASPFDIQTLVEARLGTMVAGQTLHVNVAVIDTATGLRSGFLRDQSVVIDTP